MIRSNEDGTAGGLAGLFMLFVVCAVIIALIAPLPDKLNDINNGQISVPGAVVSQERLNTMKWLSIAFGSMGLIILIGAGINYWVTCIRTQNQEV